MFLLWIWLPWMIVLFGAEVAFTSQHVGLLGCRDKLQRLSNFFIDGRLAARVMMHVAREFRQTGKPVSGDQLAEILEVVPEEAVDAARRLVRLGLLTPVGDDEDEFHPARDLSKLELSEVLSIADRFRDVSRSKHDADAAYEGRLEQAFGGAREGQNCALSGLTFRDLLLECERSGTDIPDAPKAG